MLEKILRYGIKIAAVLLTTPATIAVAGSLYPDQPIMRLMVQAAGLVLVEGALLLGWHMLDTEKQATTAQRILYAVIATVGYLVLWVIAVAHGEGIAGIAFRATLGVLLFYSVAESGILAGIKLQRAADRDIAKHWRVAGYRRQAEIKIARLKVDSWSQLEAKRIGLELERDSGSLEVTVNQDSDLTTPTRGDLESINKRRKVQRAQRHAAFRRYLVGHPELPASAAVEWAVVRFGVAESTAWRDYSELKPEPVATNGNGNGHK